MQNGAPGEYRRAEARGAVASRARRRGVERRRSCRRRWKLIDVETDVTGNEQVEPSIAVEIAERTTGRPVVDRDLCCVRDVAERPSPIVVVEAVLAKVRDVHVLEAVVVDVADAHALPPALVRDAARNSDVLESPVAFVAEERGGRSGIAASQTIEGRAVDEVEIDVAVVVEIPERDAGPRPFDDVVLLGTSGDVLEAGDPGGGCHVPEGHTRRRMWRRRRHACGWWWRLRQRDSRRRDAHNRNAEAHRGGFAGGPPPRSARASALARSNACWARSDCPIFWYARPRT